MNNTELVQVILGAFAVLNTALLVYQHVKLGTIGANVDGAKVAAETAAHTAGLMQGLAISNQPSSSGGSSLETKGS